MISGAYPVGRVIEESHCRLTEDSFLTDPVDYKIHSTSLMANIPFEKSKIYYETIDSSIFLNDGETKLNFTNRSTLQNYLTTQFIGRYPLKFYGAPTKMGTLFKLICRHGDPSYKYRKFGTEGAMSINASANDLTTFKG